MLGAQTCWEAVKKCAANDAQIGAAKQNGAASATDRTTTNNRRTHDRARHTGSETLLWHMAHVRSTGALPQGTGGDVGRATRAQCVSCIRKQTMHSWVAKRSALNETHGPEWLPNGHYRANCATAGNYASGVNSDPYPPNPPNPLTQNEQHAPLGLRIRARLGRPP